MSRRHPRLGTCRIVQTDLQDHADMLQPAFIRLEHGGRGEIRFGRLVAGLEADRAQPTPQPKRREADSSAAC